MPEKKDPGMKSAYELAMERLEKKEGKQASCTDEQREALGRVDEDLRAKTAELEIMHQQRVMDARASGDAALLQELETELRAEKQRLRERADVDKARIREA